MNAFFSGAVAGIALCAVCVCLMGCFYGIRDEYRWVVGNHWIYMGYDQHSASWKNEITGRVITNSPYHWPSEHKRTPIL